MTVTIMVKFIDDTYWSLSNDTIITHPVQELFPVQE